MKKFFSCTLLFLIAICASACGSNNNKPTSRSVGVNPSTNTQEIPSMQQINKDYDIIGVMKSMTVDTTLKDIERLIGFAGEIVSESENEGTTTIIMLWNYRDEYDRYGDFVAEERSGGAYPDEGELIYATISDHLFTTGSQNAPKLYYIPDLTFDENEIKNAIASNKAFTWDEIMGFTGGVEGIPIQFGAPSIEKHERDFIEYAWYSDTHRFKVKRSNFDLGIRDDVWYITAFAEMY